MKIEIQNPYPDKKCFFCGSDNDHGLKLKFFWDQKKEETSTEYLPAKHFVGQGDILHGAIQMGLLDEIMGWTCVVFTGEMAVTSDISINFLRPIYIFGEKIQARCQAISQNGATVHLQAKLFNSKGDICTKASATFHIISSEKYEKIISAS